MLLTGTRAEIDADHILNLSSDALRRSVISHLRDELLSSTSTVDLTLVITDWQGRMPEEVRGILGELVRAQTRFVSAREGASSDGAGRGPRLAGLDLHGQVGWFVALLSEQRGVFESRDSWMRSLELSLVDEDAWVGDLPRFGNLRALRLFQPELSAAREWLTELLRHNLRHNLTEFACVARSSAEPFLAAVRELDATPSPDGAGGPPTLAELAAAVCVCAGATAKAVSEQGYPQLAVAALEHVETLAHERKTSLWLRGPDKFLREALSALGEAIARSRLEDGSHANVQPRDRSFVARLGRLRLDAMGMPAGGLPGLRAHARRALRDSRLGSAAHLGLKLSVEAQVSEALLGTLLAAALPEASLRVTQPPPCPSPNTRTHARTHPPHFPSPPLAGPPDRGGSTALPDGSDLPHHWHR